MSDLRVQDTPYEFDARVCFVNCEMGLLIIYTVLRWMGS